MENESSWNTPALMAETTNVRLVRILTMPTVVEYCGVNHCGAFASLSSLYSALDAVLFIALCSNENSSSPPHLILGNHIPVRNIDGNFCQGHFTLVLEGKLGSSNMTCALRQLPMQYMFRNSGVIDERNVSKPPETRRPQREI